MPFALQVKQLNSKELVLGTKGNPILVSWQLVKVN
jgi:hypothetical protein